ncbi:hypothetical protein ACIHFE_34110 [Streptomyces sp. NPDC052396]|uniref:hypothetical protein n=1 Tax=Streptomyces sp. NPDC052396 TaxID=3365689 RepID=UPI0037CFC019
MKPKQRRAIPVLLLSCLAIACLVVWGRQGNALDDRTSAACRWLAVPWSIYATAYGVALSAVAAIAAYVWDARYRAPGELPAWPAALGVVLAVPLLVLGAGAVWLTYDEAADVAGKVGHNFCM